MSSHSTAVFTSATAAASFREYPLSKEEHLLHLAPASQYQQPAPGITCTCATQPTTVWRTLWSSHPRRLSLPVTAIVQPAPTLLQARPGNQSVRSTVLARVGSTQLAQATRPRICLAEGPTHSRYLAPRTSSAIYSIHRAILLPLGRGSSTTRATVSLTSSLG